MEKEFFEEMDACLRDRLGRVYTNDSKYQEAIKIELTSYELLKEELPESQSKMLDEYRSMMYATQGVCEVLAYRQGMRDMAEIMGVKDEVD